MQLHRRPQKPNRPPAKLSLVTLALLIGIAGCASEGHETDPGVPGVPSRVEAEERSPFVATLLAVFPGIIVHGIGNYYAGNSEKGEELMAEEGLSVVAMGIGAGLNYLAYVENGHTEHSHGAEEVLGRFEEVSEYVGGGLAGAIGVGTFFHSWIKDIMDAGDSATAHNREVRRLYDERIHPVREDEAVPPYAGAPGRHEAPGARPAPTPIERPGPKPATPHSDDGTVPGSGVAPVASPQAPTAHPGNH